MLNAIPDGLQYAGACVLAALVTALAVKPLRELAIRTDFLDRPVGYKRHAQPTPYLGGIAVMSGVVIGMAVFGDGSLQLVTTILCAAALLGVGTLDDRVGLPIAPRLATQSAAGLSLWAAGAGWDVGQPAADLALTILWVIAVTNAFNLMDNLDGATGTVAMTSALGVGVLAVSSGDSVLGVSAFALAGACGGFLPFNLASPSRIFLGDGGSLPIGYLVAAYVMDCQPDSLGMAGILAVAPLAGLAIFDTALVVISRYRRGVTILNGARDHLTHRLYARLRSPRRVAIVLALSQGALCLLAISLHALDRDQVTEAAGVYLICGLIALAALESPRAPRLEPAQDNQPA